MTNRPAKDEGSALVLALIVVMVISIILGAVLTMAQTTQRTTVHLNSETQTSRNADNAVQAAVNAMQNGTFINEDGTPCFQADDTPSDAERDIFPYDSAGPGSVAVVCSGTPGSGVQHPEVPITQANKPGNAILTLGEAPTDGVDARSTYSYFSRFDVGGPVFSHGPISTYGKGLTAKGYVRARGICSDPTLLQPAPAQCKYDGFEGGMDPDYDKLLPSTVPPLATVPSGSGCFPILNPTVAFEPGYYNNAAALNALTTNAGDSCTTYWFKPGVYYFDFSNAGTHEWKVSDGRLVAGTRTGIFSRDCISPLKSQTNGGVQFIFGGNSRLTVSGEGSAAICGQYSKFAPAMAVQGVKVNATPPAWAAVRPSGVLAGVSGFVLTSPDAASAFAGQGAVASGGSSASLPGIKNQPVTGHIEMATASLPAAVPAGSFIESATVVLRHKNATAKSGDKGTISIQVPGIAQPCVPPSITLEQNGSFHDHSIDVLAGCSGFKDSLQSNGIPANGTILTYSAQLAKSNTNNPSLEVVDQLVLNVKYRSTAAWASVTPSGDLTSGTGDARRFLLKNPDSTDLAHAGQGPASSGGSYASLPGIANQTVTGYMEMATAGLPAAVPPGSTIQSASVVLRHRNGSAKPGDTGTVTITVPGIAQPCVLPSFALDTNAAFHDHSIDVLAGCSGFKDSLQSKGIPATGTILKYSAKLVSTANPSAEEVDQLELSVKYTPPAPAFRPQQGTAAGDTSCDLSAVFQTNADGTVDTGCAALNVRSGFGSFLNGYNATAINGTVYTPHAAVAVKLGAIASSGLRSGVIARSFYLRSVGIFSNATVASIPYSPQGLDPSAYLTAYVCETADKCSATTGRPVVEAKVTLLGQTVGSGIRREARIMNYHYLQ